MSGTHSLWSPSKADRWTCHGAMAACIGIEDKSGEAAALGTAKHEISEWCLTNDRTADCCVGQSVKADGYEFQIDDEFADHVNMYVTGARLLPGVKRYEYKVDTSNILGIPEQGGTIDLLSEDREARTLIVADAKFGYKRVSAKGNRQMTTYGSAALDELDPFGVLFDNIRLMIFQPQASDLPDEHTYTRDELYVEMAVIAADARAGNALIGATPEAIEAAKKPSPKACEWCPIRSTCIARANGIANMFPVIPSATAVVPASSVSLVPTQLETAKIAVYLERIDEVEKWCRDIRAEALRRAMAGDMPPGWKLIEGRKGNRTFPEKSLVELAAVPVLGDDAYEPRELKSPAQLEKAYKKAKKSAEWAELAAWAVTQPNGAPSLARADEPGVPVAPAAEFGLVEVS